MIENDYPLGFRVRLHRKDLGIALESARELGVTLPVAAFVEQVETGLMARGYGDEDMSAVARCIREPSNIG
jgi:3-hydroxyisobutyrate dehydrogenase